MNDAAIPPWLREELGKLSTDFYGKLVLHYEHGRVVRIEKSESIVPQTMTAVSVRRGG